MISTHHVLLTIRLVILAQACGARCRGLRFHALCTILLSFFVILQTTALRAQQSIITAATWTPDRSQIVLGSQSGLELRSWPSLEVQRTFATELTNIHDVRFSQDGTKLLAAGGVPAEEGSVEIWSWPDASRVANWLCHRDVIYQAAWTADDRQIVTAGADGLCHLLDSDQGQTIRTYREHSGPVLALQTGANSTVYSASVDQTIRQWSVDTGESLRTLDNHLGPVVELAITQDQDDESLRLFSLSEDRTVRLWRPDIGRMMRFFKCPATPRAVAVASHQPLVFIGCDDGVVRVLDRDTMTLLQSIATPYGRITTLLLAADQRSLFASGSAGFGLVVIPRD
jgi:WD40 repeat protein